MANDDPLYKAFLTELESLEKFRITYSGMHPHVPLSREDPDIRRITEALAMFTARTRRAGERSLGLSMLRLFRQHFPFLLSPTPSMAMLHARVTPRFVDAGSVPRGAEVVVSPLKETLSSQKLPARLSFRTLAPIRILPITLDRVDLFAPESGGYRMVLGFSAAHDRVDPIEQLALYINHLNDFQSSLTVQYALKRHLKRASIVFDQDVREDTSGTQCTLSFGAEAVPNNDFDLLAHPLERVRSVLHFPQQEMFLTVKVSTQPRNWRRFSLIFELDPRWPKELKLTPDTFQLHVAPMINLVRAMADPIPYDATQDRYPVMHPDVALRFRLHSVTGAYRLDQDEGLVPLRPGIIGEREHAYEIETEGQSEQRRAFLALDMPQAFGEPFRVAVDALWHQPVLEDDKPFEYQAGLFDRYLEGLTWECLGAFSKARDSALGDDISGLLELLSLKNKRFLDRDELVFLLEAVGATSSRVFSPVLRAISEVRVDQVPYARGTSGFKYVYHVTFSRLDLSDLPLLDLFAQQALLALKAWSVDEVVELSAKVPTLEQTFTYT